MIKKVSAIVSFILLYNCAFAQYYNSILPGNKLVGSYAQGVGSQATAVDSDSTFLASSGWHTNFKNIMVRRYHRNSSLIDSAIYFFPVSGFVHIRAHAVKPVSKNHSGLLIDFIDSLRFSKLFLLDDNLDTLKSTTIKSDTIWRVYSYDFLVEDSTITVVCQLNRHLYNDQQLLIAQFDTALNPLWQSTIPDWRGQQGGYFPARIMRLHDAYYVAGYCQYPNWIEGFVVKTDLNGNKIWDKRYRNGTGNTSVNDLIMSGDTIYLLSNDNSSAVWDITMWLTKIDTSGNVLSDTIYAPINGLQSRNIIQTQDGNFVIAGYYDNNFTYNANGILFKIDRNFNILWQRSYVHKSSYDQNRLWRIHQWPDGNLLATGSLEWWDNRPPNVPHDHVWLLSLDSNGCLAPNNCGVLSMPEEPWPEKEAGFLVYPNPAREFVEIRWDWFALDINSPFTITIINSRGELCYSLQVTDWQNNVALLRTDKLCSGIYMVKIIGQMGESKAVKKLSIIK